ncbi:MAG: hypothetical protein QM737_02705 [Ferruginibacter sp.]
MNFFWSHKQVHDVFYGDDFDFNAERQLNYPVAVIDYQNTSYNGKLKFHNYNVVLVDLIDDNIAGIEDDIYSDMEMIADDFRIWLQYQEGWSYDGRMTLNKIVNDGGDRFAGFEFQVSIQVASSMNLCAKPGLIPE